MLWFFIFLPLNLPTRPPIVAAVALFLLGASILGILLGYRMITYRRYLSTVGTDETGIRLRFLKAPDYLVPWTDANLEFVSGIRGAATVFQRPVAAWSDPTKGSAERTPRTSELRRRSDSSCTRFPRPCTYPNLPLFRTLSEFSQLRSVTGSARARITLGFWIPYSSKDSGADKQAPLESRGIGQWTGPPPSGVHT